jgi:hypothetical protein
MKTVMNTRYHKRRFFYPLYKYKLLQAKAWTMHGVSQFKNVTFCSARPYLSDLTATSFEKLCDDYVQKWHAFQVA